MHHGGELARAALAALALAGAGCRERAQEIQSAAELNQVVDQMMPAVTRATGLTFKRHPVLLRRSRAQVRSYVMRKFDADLSPTELTGVQTAYRLFGLLPDSIDLRRTMIDLLTEQVAGYYDPDSNALFLPEDIDPAQARIVISHELVHALQHQYVDLDSLIQQPAQNDRRTAAQSVLEGQATLAQILVLMPEQRIESLPNFWTLRSALGEQQAQMSVFAHAPLWLRESLIFPYLAGAEFVRAFERAHPGKEPFGTLMPTSTEQILHPDRYEAGDAPRRVTFVRDAADTLLYENDLGEFETRLLLEQCLGDEQAATDLATGWAGDRYEVLGHSGDALVWYSVWDTPSVADRFAKGLERAWKVRRSSEPAGRRAEIARMTIGTAPAVRLVDAPAAWPGWKRLPRVTVQ